jgi:MFS family permease
MTAHEKRRHHNVTFVVLAVGGISYALLQSLVAPALLNIQHALHTSEDSVSWVLTAYLLLGSGIGLAFAAMANLIIENVGPAETGVATGMNTVTRTVGGAFGGAAAASVIAGTVEASTGFPTAHGYAHAFGLCAAALLAGVLVGLAIPQRRPEAAFGAHAVGDLETVAAESP